MFETATQSVEDDVFGNAKSTEDFNSFVVPSENNLISQNTSAVSPLSKPKLHTTTFETGFQSREPPPIDSFVENGSSDKEISGFGVFTDVNGTFNQTQHDFGDFTNFSSTNADQGLPQGNTESSENTFSSFSSFPSNVSGTNTSEVKDKYSVFSEIANNHLASTVPNDTDEVKVVPEINDTTNDHLKLDSNLHSDVLPNTDKTTIQTNTDDSHPFGEFSSLPCKQQNEISPAPVVLAPKVVSNFDFGAFSDNTTVSADSPPLSIPATSNPPDDFGSFAMAIQDEAGSSNKEVPNIPQSESSLYIQPKTISSTESFGCLLYTSPSPRDS